MEGKKTKQGNGPQRALAMTLSLLLATPSAVHAQQARPAGTPTQAPIVLVPTPATQAAPRANTTAVATTEFPEPTVNPAYSRPAASTPATPLPERVRVHTGQAMVYRLPQALKRVAVGSGDLVEVTNIGKREIVVIGTKVGDTSLHLWMQDGSQFDVPVQVMGGNSDNLADLVRSLTADIPGVQVHTVGDRVVVTGNDVNPGLSGRLEKLAQVYPNLMDFTTPDPVGMRPMVLMDVKIMEFDSNALEDIGIRWDNVIQGPMGALLKDFSTNPYFRVPPSGTAFDGVTLPNRIDGTQTYFGIATQIGSSINLLMNKGKAVLLASPQLSARSGGSATFLVGGEVPIPIPQGFGQVTIQYKEYGIKLDIEPLVNINNEVSTRFKAEVSRIDPTVTVQGVPGFATRRTESEINVHAGETIVVSGLVDSQAAKNAEKFPFLGDIPILGRLFRSDAFRGSRTELVMFVTPRIVTPDSPENVEALRRASELRDQGLQDQSRRNREFVQ